MTDAIGPGDMVEFIGPDDSPMGPSGLTVGGVYKVQALLRGAVRCGQGCGYDRLVLAAGNWNAYCACAFKPLYRPRRGFIADLLKPVRREKTDA